jgi:CDP-4-dehydro-6-deoxyglucose reductase
MQQDAQKGLKPTLQKQGLFLACQFKPADDVLIDLPETAGINCPARVVSKDMLNHNVLRLVLRAETAFACEPGQYVTVINREAVARSYSIANNPAKDGGIELHIRLVAGGLMSMFVRDRMKVGDSLTLRGPAGTCFYVPEEGSDYPMVLAGTGTGLAPLIGIAKEALGCGHQGEIQLFHGALRTSDLYMGPELMQLAERHGNFQYRPCVLEGETGQHYLTGDVGEIVMACLPADKKSTRLFLCGAPEMVNSMRRKAFLGGVASKHIFADPFLPSKQLPSVA